jgi:hypothetical protein
MIEKLLPRRLRPEDQRFIALAVSAFVFPGAGQCMAGRWLIGVAFALGCLMTFCAAAILLFWPPLLHAAAWLEEYSSGSTGLETPGVQWKWFLVSATSNGLLYAWNLLDAWLQVRRDLSQ